MEEGRHVPDLDAAAHVGADELRRVGDGIDADKGVLMA